VWLGTPRATFSAARWQVIPGNPNAPRPLRDLDFPGGYKRTASTDDDTVPQLTTKEKEELEQGDIFAQKSADTFKLCRSLRTPVALENPSPRPDNLSLFDLEVYKTLAADTETPHVDFPQCPYGSTTTKPTRVLYWGADFAHLDRGKCPREDKLRTYTQWNRSTSTKWGKHPLLVNSTTKGKASTAATAAYPAALN
jgi:hypothetical protein